MLDFMKPALRQTKNGYEIYPKFIVKSSSDLMVKGSDFYAIWNEKEKLWSTDEGVALMLIDQELDDYYEKTKVSDPEVTGARILYMWDSDTGMVDKWHKYVQKQCRDYFKPLDENLTFSNTETKKSDNASKRLSYPLEECPIPAWNELVGTLYSPIERQKIEWAIGAVVSGDSKKIQKFIVMYGAPKTGKSTILNIIEELFKGYVAVFDAKAVGSSSSAFALEAFRSNPLVAIQHDGNLSKIEDNTRLNSLISHEMMLVNEKRKTQYSMKFNSFLFIGTNNPVKITDSKSGIIRRLIDISPTGEKIPRAKYDQLMDKIKFELGGIAFHCLNVYLSNPKRYDDYIPTLMIGASNDFYNYVLSYYDAFKSEDGTTLKIAWERYNKYCDEARVPFRYQQRVFKEELKSYFKEYIERGEPAEDGTTIWNIYKGFIADKFIGSVFDSAKAEKKEEVKEPEDIGLVVNCTASLLDDICKDWPAQYATEDGKPIQNWDNVKTTLKDLDTSRTHYLFFPDEYKTHIVIDFDLTDESGNKSFELNAKAAAKWPATYAEVSKGGEGIHLHYIYTGGDPDKLSRIYEDGIEIKVFLGKSSLRRRVSRCNDIPIATISSGLPFKEDKKIVNFEGLKNEKALRTIIRRSLLKEYAPHATVTSVEFIKKVLDDAYASGMEYDVSDMRPAITTFAGRSSHHAGDCLTMVTQMKFKSEKELTDGPNDYQTNDIVIWDFEVFSNGYLVAYKALGKEPRVKRNPSPKFIEKLLKFRLVGHNTRGYDNHIAMGIIMGDTISQVYSRSQKLTSNDRDGFIGAAWNIHYADTYEFPVKKQGLKKWEIELGIHHQELGLPWDQPVPDDMWSDVEEYCKNDVVATEALWNHLQGDFLAREILAELANGRINMPTNALSGKLIFDNDKNPQVFFKYRNLAEPVHSLEPDMEAFLRKNFPKMMAEPFGEAKSLLPYFPGYHYDIMKPKKLRSTYRGLVVGEGGYVWAKPGIYTNVVTFDIASMHPHSITSEYLFGKYTDVFNDLMEARIAIKHKDYEHAGKMFDGRLAKYLTPDSDPKVLSNALKIVINSIYGKTAQEEKNGYVGIFRDSRNIDNIVAKRGALFMIDLLTEVLAKGGNVVHIKTDSIKVSNPSKELQEFILSFGERYGYTFEIEHKFEKICLVNDAVFIAKCAADDADNPGKWSPTGKQFMVPYVYKKLFSKEPVTFDDMCETVNSESALYLDMNEGLPDVSMFEKEKLLRTYNAAYPEKKPKKLGAEFAHLTDDQLDAEIAKGHNYKFVGKTGRFTPIKPGLGGGDLVRRDAGGYKFSSGASGYKWLESEQVIAEGRQADLNEGFYINLVDEALKTIGEYGDAEWFCE